MASGLAALATADTTTAMVTTAMVGVAAGVEVEMEMVGAAAVRAEAEERPFLKAAAL